MSEKTKNGFNLAADKTAIWGPDLVSPECRIAFADNLVTAKSSKEGAKPKFGCTLLASKSDEAVKADLKKIQATCALMLQDLFGDKAADAMKTFKANRMYFRDGDTPSATGKIYTGYEGMWAIVAKNEFGAGHSRGFKVIGKLPEQFESGMIVRASIQPYLNQDGFSWGLRAIKFIKDDGTRFGGAPDASGLLDEFDSAVDAAANSNNSGLNVGLL